MHVEHNCSEVERSSGGLLQMVEELYSFLEHVEHAATVCSALERSSGGMVQKLQCCSGGHARCWSYLEPSFGAL